MAIQIPITDYAFDLSMPLQEEFWHIKKNLHLNLFYQLNPPYKTQLLDSQYLTNLGLFLIFPLQKI